MAAVDNNSSSSSVDGASVCSSGRVGPFSLSTSSPPFIPFPYPSLLHTRALWPLEVCGERGSERVSLVDYWRGEIKTQ